MHIVALVVNVRTRDLSQTAFPRIVHLMLQKLRHAQATTRLPASVPTVARCVELGGYWAVELQEEGSSRGLVCSRNTDINGGVSSFPLMSPNWLASNRAKTKSW